MILLICGNFNNLNNYRKNKYEIYGIINIIFYILYLNFSFFQRNYNFVLNNGKLNKEIYLITFI